MRTQANNIIETYNVVGDSAYPISKYLMTPYKNYGVLSQGQKKYNQHLSSKRQVCWYWLQILSNEPQWSSLLLYFTLSICRTLKEPSDYFLGDSHVIWDNEVHWRNLKS